MSETTTISNPAESAPIRLADYRPSAFGARNVKLHLRIHEDHTRVISRVTYHRNDSSIGELILDAQDPNPSPGSFLVSIEQDGHLLQPVTAAPVEAGMYFYDAINDRIHLNFGDGSKTTLIIETYLEPQGNSALSGFYKSDRCFVTQCESEGFRRITPFLDRPDVMSTYDVTLEAPRDLCPVLISNGNLVEASDIGDGWHRARFEDPWPKPSYLFATANGQLDSIEDTFVTSGGRKVRLRVYTDTNSAEKGYHAMDALKRSMKWDEDTFGCEYDLDDYGVVAVAKFSMGAMENKGLNVFRDSLVLASPDTATDGDYQSIIDVIGHEYFHNYSGNRVTLANWFHLSLKEGLTVNREQLFTAFTTSDATERIGAVQVLRRGQFPEDDGPNSHPVLPSEIGAVDNIYSPTVYLKGSEVIRMMKTMMGEARFIEGVKDYFRTYDGRAVTISEFVASMEKASGLNFSDQFRLWYTQSGRPRIRARGTYDASTRSYTLELEQSNEPTRDQKNKEAMLIPIQMALIDSDGRPLPLKLRGESDGPDERVILLEKEKQSFVFKDLDRAPAFHSLLRNFSAPVDLEPGLSEDQLHEQLLKDTDGFNRWDAGQKLALAEMRRIYEALTPTENMSAHAKANGASNDAKESSNGTGSIPSIDLSPRYLETVGQMISQRNSDPNLVALALSMPAINELESLYRPVDPAAVARVRKTIRSGLARALQGQWEEAFAYATGRVKHPYQFDYQDTGLRRIVRLALDYLVQSDPGKFAPIARDFYFSADNMTDRIAAMSALVDHQCSERSETLQAFFDRFSNDALTIQKYFMHRAISGFEGVISELRSLIESDQFNWEIPGHVQNLYRGFIANYEQFHRADGEGYAFLADGVIHEAAINGTTASGLIVALCRYQEYAEPHRSKMKGELLRIQSTLEEGLTSGRFKKVDVAPVRDRLLKALGEQ